MRALFTSLRDCLLIDWVATADIRGAGLAYGADISQDQESGLIYYRIFKSPDSHAAYEAAKKLVDGLVSGEVSSASSGGEDGNHD